MAVTAHNSLWYGSFMATLSPVVRDRLMAAGHLLHFREGETIFRQNDRSHSLYIVKSGTVAIQISVPNRGTRTILTVGPWDVFSWSALIEPRIETASACAREDSDVLAIDSKTLLRMCSEDHSTGFELYRALARVVSARLAATRVQLIDQANGQ